MGCSLIHSVLRTDISFILQPGAKVSPAYPIRSPEEADPSTAHSRTGKGDKSCNLLQQPITAGYLLQHMEPLMRKAWTQYTLQLLQLTRTVQDEDNSPQGLMQLLKLVVRKPNWQPAKSSSHHPNNILFLFCISSPDVPIPAQQFKRFGPFTPDTTVKCRGRRKRPEHSPEHTLVWPQSRTLKKNGQVMMVGFLHRDTDFNSQIKTRSLNEKEDGLAEEEYSSQDVAIERWLI